MLVPQGSGSAQAAIRLSAYGEGARPLIVAGSTNEQAFRLFNQEYWDIDSLDFSGGRTHGIFVSGDKGGLYHIHLKNLVVHAVLGGEMKSKDNGLVLITPGSLDQRFDDVLVDGVTAWSTQKWMGILIGGGKFGFPPESTWSTNVVIRNSMVHDVQGEASYCSVAAAERSSPAWHGTLECRLQRRQARPTPSGHGCAMTAASRKTRLFLPTALGWTAVLSTLIMGIQKIRSLITTTRHAMLLHRCLRRRFRGAPEHGARKCLR